MTHDDLVAVLLLLWVCPVDVAAEGCLDTRAVFVVLLGDGKDESRCEVSVAKVFFARPVGGRDSQVLPVVLDV